MNADRGVVFKFAYLCTYGIIYCHYKDCADMKLPQEELNGKSKGHSLLV